MRFACRTHNADGRSDPVSGRYARRIPRPTSLTSLPIRARRLLAITDLTDEQNPEQLSRTSYATAAYVHQGWLTPNHKYFLSNDELDKVGGEVSSTTTYMWDLCDLDDPLMGWVRARNPVDRPSAVHQGRHRDRVELHVWCPRPEHREGPPRKAQHQRLLRPVPGPGRGGLRRHMGQLPFFDSGTAVATGMEEGLFVLRPRGEARP